MKRIVLFLFIIVLNTLSAKEWTIMVFINGDNNLDEYAFLDFNELEIAGSDENINILIQYDRFEVNSQANWSGAKRFFINTDYDFDVINSEEIMDLGEVDSGNYNTVVDFVNWGKSNYPADNYALIIWDHGSGWQKKTQNTGFYKSISSDDTSGSRISVANGDFEAMLSDINVILGKKLDFLGLDACLMGMWEVTFSSEAYVRFMAFSEELENGSGWEYYTLMDLFKAGDKSAKSLCESVVNSSLDSVGATLSCIDLSFLPSLTENINKFATKFKDDHSIDFEILTAYSNTLSMETEEYYRDFGLFFNNLILLVNDDIKIQWIAPILNDYFSSVVLSKGKDTDVADYSDITGFTIFMNMGGEFYEDEESSYLSSRWANDTNWDEFINREFYFDEDEYEPDNTLNDAYYNENLLETNHSIHRRGDVDFMKLNLKKGFSYVFETSCSQYDTYMMLLDETGRLIKEDDDSGLNRCSSINYFSEENKIVYIKTYTYENESIAIYSLKILETQRTDDFPNSLEGVKDSDKVINGLNAEINYDGDIDFLYIDGDINKRYVIETVEVTLDDTILSIYDVDNNLIDENDDIDTANKNYMSKIIFEPKKNERYYISIKAYKDNTGKYGIKLTEENKCVETNGGIELCDGIDNNCDGNIDENLIIPDSDKNKGVCNGSKKICDGINGWIEPDYTKITNYETPEAKCDGLDNDCDGEVDNNLIPLNNMNQKGVCKDSKMSCNGVNGWIEDYSKVTNYSKTDDNNDNFDNNCDGQIDEGFHKESGGCSYGSNRDNTLYLMFFIFVFIYLRKRINLIIK